MAKPMSEESVDMLVAMVKPYVDYHRLAALNELADRARRLKTAEDALERTRSVARNGVAADTTAEQALNTIAEYIDRRLAAIRPNPKP